MDYDTDIGGPSGAFPATHYAVILASGSSDSEARKQALEVIVAAYWKPIYKYIRLTKGASNENAKDLTQAFFVRALDKGFFQRYDPSKARFRTYLRVCVERFLANERKSAGSCKRGGDREVLALDFESAEREMGSLPTSTRCNPDD